MHKMKMIMEKLEEYVCEELNKDKSEICAKELAEVIDSIKDCATTMYNYRMYEKSECEHCKCKENIEMYIDYLFKELNNIACKASTQEKELLKKKMAEIKIS